MADPTDPSLLSYPALPPSTLDNASDNPSLINLDSPTVPARNTEGFPSNVGGFPSSTGNQSLTTVAGGNPSNSGGLSFNSEGAQFSFPTSFGGVSPVATDTVHHQHSALHSMHNPKSGLYRGTGISTDPQTLKVQYLEQMCSKLQKENNELQENFGRQRKKFMDKMVEMEFEQNLLKNTIARYDMEVRDISTQLLAKDEELKNINMAAKMSERQTKEDFDADRVKYEEEIASLSQIMKVQSQEQSEAFNRERDAWKREREGMMAEVQRLKHSQSQNYAQPPYPTQPQQFPQPAPPPPHYTHPPSTHPPHFTQPTPPTHQPAQHPQSPSSLPLRSTEGTPAQASQSPENENLEYDMAKAAMDTKLLRSVVVPLEEEIDLLKVKLSEAQEQLAYYESQNSVPRSEATPPLIDFDMSPTSPTGSGDTDTVTQLQHQLTLERSARQDLEMHTEALVQQKTLTHQEILVLTQELEKFRNKYKTESSAHEALKTEYRSLKQTWELANKHFLVEQNALKEQIHTLKEKLERPSPLEGKEAPVSGGAMAAEEGLVKSLMVPRTHKRSQSSEGEEIAHGQLLRRMSSSLPVLDQLSDNTTENDPAAGELTSLQGENEMLRDELARKSKACTGYESQLQRVQRQMVEELDQKERDIDRLRAEMEKLKAGVMRERETQKKLRRTIQEEVEQMKAKMDTFKQTENKVKAEIRKRKDNFTELKHDTQTEIVRLTDDRNDLRKQMDSAREEYDCLKVLQSQQLSDYQQSINAEKAARKEAELNVQTTMNQLSTVQSKLQTTEEELCTQLQLVTKQLRTETQQKEDLTSELTRQLASSKRENEGLQTLKADIEAERRAKEEALSSKSSIQEKSTVFIQDQQKQIEKLHKEKDAKEKQIVELTRQMSSLKHQLDRTAETQKDFVELSQSLQMKLVEMEESQKSNSSDSVS